MKPKLSATMAQGLATSLSEITTVSWSAGVNHSGEVFTVSRVPANLDLQPVEQRRELLRQSCHGFRLFLRICNDFYSSRNIIKVNIYHHRI